MTSDNRLFSATTGNSSPTVNTLIPVSSKGVPGEIQILIDASRGFAAQSKASSTQRAYRGDWKAFDTWCRTSGLLSLPAEPATVVLYLSHLAGSGKKVATISRTLVSIRQAHKMAGHPSPTSAFLVLETMKGIRRSIGTAQIQKAPLLVEQLRAAAQSIPLDLLGLRDRALMLLGFSIAARRSELVAIDIEDLEIHH